MEKFVRFRHLSNGVIADYPEHYEHHPVFGHDLVRLTPYSEPEPVVVVKASKPKKVVTPDEDDTADNNEEI